MNDPIARASRQQAQAADPARDAFVIANAGSGKTKVLVDRVTRLLLDGARPDGVLCLTYTKAAASEMQERLFARLGEWAVLNDASLGAKLTELAGAETAESGLDKARRLFARALETPGGLKVQTIHAFCERLLRRFPLEAGVPPGFSVLEDSEAAALIAGARDALPARADREPQSGLAEALAFLAEEVADKESEAMMARLIEARPRHQAILRRLGGPEAAQRAVYERLNIDPGATPETIKAGAVANLPRESLERCAEALARGGANDVKAAPYLELAARADVTGAYEALIAACFTKEGELIKKGLGGKQARQECPELAELFGDRESPGPVSQALLDGEAALARLTCARASAAAIALSGALTETYEAAKRIRRAVDFTDLIDRASLLLRQSDARDWVRYKLDGGIDHILIDEAQDTAPAQWDLVDALTEEFFAGEDERNPGRSLFAVGDEKQSIYSFQGAEPERFLSQTQDYVIRAQAARRPSEAFQLDVSFRSAPAVLGAVDAVFASETAIKILPDRPPGGDLARHESARPDRETRSGLVELWAPAPQPEPGPDEDPWTAPVDAPSPGSAPERLAEAIAAETSGWLDAGMIVWDRDEGDRPIRAGDVMILLRRRNAFFYEIIRQLKRAGVPVAGADRLTLTEQQAVRDLLALARFALQPEDDLSLAEALKSPWLHPAGAAQPPIDDAALFDLAYGRKGRLWPALKACDDPRFAEARTLLQAMRGRVDIDTPYAFYAGLLNHVGADGISLRARILRRLGEEAEDALDEFLSRAMAHQSRGAPSLTRFVAEMSRDLSDIKREMSADASAVRVMTVHGAKGLESPVVILPDTTQKPAARMHGLFEDDDCGLIWSPYKSGEPELAAALRERREAREYGEYLRQLYVAMTRAKDRLLVCGYRHGKGGRVDDESWHALIHNALLTQGAVIETPFGEGLRLGAPETMRAAAERASPAGAPTPDWLNAPWRDDSKPPRRRAAPSSLADMEAGGRAYSPLEDEVGERFLRGSIIHKLLEILPELPAETRETAAQTYLDRRAELDSAAREDILSSALSVLNDAQFAPLFGPGSRAEVSVVGGAEALPEGVVINGQVDRLVTSGDSVLVVDYKTNRPPPADPESVDPAYIRQMAAYRAVLANVFPGKAIRCALLWTETAHLMEIESERMDAALAWLKNA